MEETLEILKRLIGFRTVSADSNLEMIHYMEAFLTERGFRIARIKDDTGQKAGLYAEIGPPGQGILVSGHSDVVPVTGQNWTREPFQLTREGDRIYGRGTTDMKGFIACALSAADKASQRGLKEPLKLVFSYDEEIGCVGMQSMISELQSLIGQPRFCLIGEPTEMKVAIGHKGKVALKATCFGENGHSALAPIYVNALHLAAEFVCELRKLQQWLEDHGARDTAYEVPFSTIHVGRLSGGTALNIVPDRAELVFEFRYLPEDSAEDIYARITAAAAEVAKRYCGESSNARIDVEQFNAYPGLDVSADDPGIKLLLGLMEKYSLTKVPFGSEAGYFAGLGIPTVVCGPGSMQGQGHKPDEYVSIQQIESCQLLFDEILNSITQ